MSRLQLRRHRNGVWYAAGTVAGERIRKSLATRDHERAGELCALLEARLWKRSAYGDEAVRTFEEAALKYMEDGGERRFLAPLIKHFKSQPVGKITAGQIRSAAKALYPGREAATWNRHVIVPVRAILNHAHQLGWRAPISVTRFDERKAERRAVDRAWVDAFMAEARRRGLPHLAALELFMFQTAARISEACRLQWRDVDLGSRIAILRRTKNGEPREVHLSSEMVIALANLPRIKGKGVFLYASRHSVMKRWKPVCDAAGIEYVTPHQAGRHSFGTEMRRRGVDPKTGMEAGGWKSSRIYMEVYVHAPDASQTVASMFDSDTSDGMTKIASGGD